MKTKRILAASTVAAVVATGGMAVGEAVHLRDVGVAQAATAVQPNALGQLWAASVTTPDGKTQPLAAYKGKPLVVNFWASWCGPCVREMPELSALQGQYRKKGIQFIGLGVDSDANIKNFLQKVKVDYPVYVAGFGGADVARAFGDLAGGLPYTVVIDANGTVRATKLGQIKPADLRQTLDAL